MITDMILTFFESNIYLFLLVIPFLGQLWIFPWVSFFIMFAWSLANNLVYVLLLSIIVLISSVLGDITGYIIGNKFSNFKIFQCLINKKKIKKLFTISKNFINNKWEISIFLSRFLIAWIWPAINYIVWIQSFNFKKFILYVILWEALYAFELLIIWYIFKNTFEDMFNTISNFWLIILLVWVLYEIWLYLYRQKEK